MRERIPGSGNSRHQSKSVKGHSIWSVKWNVKCVGEGKGEKRLERKAGPGLEGSQTSCAKLQFILETMENHLNFSSRGMRSSKCEFLCFRKVSLATFVDHDWSKNPLGCGFLFSFSSSPFLPPSFSKYLLNTHAVWSTVPGNVNLALKGTDSLPEPTCY